MIQVRLSIMMFLQFFIWGAFFVPMGGYLGKIFASYKGELNSIIGNTYATQTWAALFAPLIVGFVADRLFNKERVNGILHLLGGGLLLWCSSITDSPTEFFWAMMAFFLCYMPTLALVNAITFQNVRSIENDFPKIRLWGTIGWIVSGLVVSQSLFGLIDIPLIPGVEDAGATSLPLQISAYASFLLGIYCFTLPASPPQGRGQPVNVVKVLGLDALQLFAKPAYAVFAICSFLICIPLAFYYARTYEFTSQMAFGNDTSGVMALGQVSEIFFMALVPFFLLRLGVKKMLLVGMVAWGLRYALFGLMPSSAAMLLVGIILHGICYDFFFVTGQLYTDRVAPREIRTSAQAFLGLITYGAGMLVGNYVLGWWGDEIKLDPTTQAGWLAGAREFWLMPAALAFGVAIIFFLTFWDKGETANAKPAENA
ncbi:MAG: MFS transporter [Planctomycetaceae bacterium]|nr:MFS transporter [Planctomycetaceae bacterium]|tara:strand:+ start:6578 stop:7855 length:1278 start_codon:yes stop_codon:yes gene_type:complete